MVLKTNQNRVKEVVKGLIEKELNTRKTINVGKKAKRNNVVGAVTT